MNWKNFWKALALTASIWVNGKIANCAEIPVSVEQQLKYEEIQKRRGLERQTIDDGISIDLISAAFVDVLGNNDWHTSKEELEKVLEQSEGNSFFYVIVLGPKEGATTCDIPFTNNPLDYSYPIMPGRKVFATQSGVVREIRKIENLYPFYKGKLNVIEVRNQNLNDNKIINPFLVITFYENKGNYFEAKDVAGYKHAVVNARKKNSQLEQDIQENNIVIYLSENVPINYSLEDLRALVSKGTLIKDQTGKRVLVTETGLWVREKKKKFSDPRGFEEYYEKYEIRNQDNINYIKVRYSGLTREKIEGTKVPEDLDELEKQIEK